MAAVTYLANSDQKIILKLGSDVSATIHSRPVMFKSPVSYTDPQTLRKNTEETEVIDDYDAGAYDEQDPFNDEASD